MSLESLLHIHCKLYHTKFAEDILRIKLKFYKKENYLESESINTDKLEFYNELQNDREIYFFNIENNNKLRQGYVYFIIESRKFIIPLKDIEYDKEAVNLGILGDKTKIGRWSKEETKEDMLAVVQELNKVDYPVTLNLF